MRGSRLLPVLIVLACAGSVIAFWPTETRIGINYEVSTYRLPLYETALHFFSRELQAQRLAKQITESATDDEERILQLFSWTLRHVHPNPPGLPIVDDHVLNILIRGYGMPDQRTEAFALLASARGFPAGAAFLQPKGSSHDLVVALVKLHGRVIVLDVANGLIFRNRSGRLASVDEIRADPELVLDACNGLRLHGIPYPRYIEQLGNTSSEPFLRMQRQSFWERLKLVIQ